MKILVLLVAFAVLFVGFISIPHLYNITQRNADNINTLNRHIRALEFDKNLAEFTADFNAGKINITKKMYYLVVEKYNGVSKDRLEYGLNSIKKTYVNGYRLYFFEMIIAMHCKELLDF